MKKYFFLIIAVIFIKFSVISQVPNNDFESWSVQTVPVTWCGIPTTYSLDRAHNWATNNFRLITQQACNNYHVTKSTDSYSGSYSIRLESIEAVDQNGTALDTLAGFAATGSLNLTTYELSYGFDLDFWPDKLTGYYKYNPGTGDSCTIGIILMTNIQNQMYPTGGGRF